MITTVGLVIFLVSLIMLIYSLAVNAMGHTQAGWTSMMMSIWLLGGLQLMAIGVIGEYVGKAYMETKSGRNTSLRPCFGINKQCGRKGRFYWENAKKTRKTLTTTGFNGNI